MLTQKLRSSAILVSSSIQFKLPPSQQWLGAGRGEPRLRDGPEDSRKPLSVPTNGRLAAWSLASGTARQRQADNHDGVRVSPDSESLCLPF